MSKTISHQYIDYDPLLMMGQSEPVAYQGIQHIFYSDGTYETFSVYRDAGDKDWRKSK